MVPTPPQDQDPVPPAPIFMNCVHCRYYLADHGGFGLLRHCPACGLRINEHLADPSDQPPEDSCPPS